MERKASGEGESGTGEIQRKSGAPPPITPHEGPITASALMVMCQHNLPSSLTNKAALIQHPRLVVDTRRPAKMSNQIGKV